MSRQQLEPFEGLSQRAGLVLTPQPDRRSTRVQRVFADVHHGLDVVVAGGCLPHDGAAVGMAGQDKISGEALQQARQIVGVVLHSVQRIDESDDA